MSIIAKSLRRRAEEIQDSVRFCQSPSDWKTHEKVARAVSNHAEDLRKFARIIEELESQITELSTLVGHRIDYVQERKSDRRAS